MTITKHFTTVKQAETYLNKLYSKYDYVHILSCPMFTENGKYIFQVK